MKPIVMGASDVAEHLGVSRQRVYQIMATDASFPKPDAELARGRVWRRADIERWAKRRASGQ